MCCGGRTREEGAEVVVAAGDSGHPPASLPAQRLALRCSGLHVLPAEGPRRGPGCVPGVSGEREQLGQANADVLATTTRNRLL
jgi:hypothetical protein